MGRSRCTGGTGRTGDGGSAVLDIFSARRPRCHRHGVGRVGAGTGAEGRNAVHPQPWSAQRTGPTAGVCGSRYRVRVTGIRPQPRDVVVGDDAKLVPDLATDTGQMSDGGKTWTFTLVDTATWQDGQKVTCEDVKYGISRTFATNVISNGPTYLLNFLDVPADADGNPAYKGPYETECVVEFDKAITCSGSTLTLHFKKPWADFNQAAASLAAYSPVRKDKDKGDKSLFEAFSNGPQMQEGAFDTNKGGTWVRNPNWDAKTDPVRKAMPDNIVDVEGIQSEQIFQLLIADGGDDKTAITFATAPAALLPQIAGNPAAMARTTNPLAPFVDFSSQRH